MSDTPLTPEQVENWRRALLGMLGPYALIMPVDQVQKMRDKFQRDADKRRVSPDANHQDGENGEK